MEVTEITHLICCKTGSYPLRFLNLPFLHLPYWDIQIKLENNKYLQSKDNYLEVHTLWKLKLFYFDKWTPFIFSQQEEESDRDIRFKTQRIIKKIIICAIRYTSISKFSTIGKTALSVCWLLLKGILKTFEII